MVRNRSTANPNAIAGRRRHWCGDGRWPQVRLFATALMAVMIAALAITARSAPARREGHARTARAYETSRLATSALASRAIANTSGQAGMTIDGLPASVQASVSQESGRRDRRYHATSRPGARLNVDNPTHGLTADFTPAGVSIRAGAHQAGIAAAGIGYGDALRPVADAAPVALENRVEYRRGGVTEWYVNGPMGLEQGFTIAERPGGTGRQAGDDPLTLALRIDGSLEPRLAADRKALTLIADNGVEALRYTGLTAWDATGAELSARLDLDRRTLLVRVDDARAQYPITIDPWVQTQVLDAISYTVLIHGDTLVVGGDNMAQVFTRPSAGTTWTRVARLTASDPGDVQLGYNVTLDGDTIAVSALRYDGGATDSGAVYVYTKPATGWQDATETARLTPSTPATQGEFGTGLSMQGDTILVGQHQPGPGGGAAYVFVEPPGGWANATETAKLLALNPVAAANHGWRVWLDGDTALVAAYAATVGGDPFAGQVFIYHKPASGWVNGATEDGVLTASDSQAGLRFGQSLALDGDTLVVGAPGKDSNAGAAYVFVRPATGWATGTEIAQLTASDRATDASMGYQFIAIDGNLIVAGAAGATIGGNVAQGAAYVFQRPASGWTSGTELQKLTALEGEANNLFGYGVAVSGTTVVVGAVGATGGKTYVFEILSLTDVSPAFGPLAGGNTITLTGTGFPPGATVTIGGVPAPFVTIINPTTIQVVVPPGAALGPVNVSVTAPGGVTSTLPNGYTYTAPSIVPPTITGVTPPNGPAGTVVTVTGTDFQPGATIRICGQDVTPTTVTSTQIVFTAPPCADGPQNVTVINPDGGSDTEPGGFTYGSLQPPTIASVTPPEGPTTGGTQVTITGTGFVPGTTVTIGGVPATNVIVLNGNTLIVTTPPGAAGTVDVTVTTPAGSATSPGAYTYRLAGTGGTDSDGDGMPDAVEISVGLNPFDPTGDNGAGGDPDHDGRTNLQELGRTPRSHPRGFFKQYFAEGATGAFFHTDVGVLNASKTSSAHLLVTLFPETLGAATSIPVQLNALQRQTLDLNAILGADWGVSTLVESDQPVAAMRQMTWQDPIYGSTLESGIPETSTTWYFGEGATNVFDLFYLIENPGETPANVTLKYLLEGAAPVTQTETVPAFTRRTVLVNAVPGVENQRVSTVVTSNVPVVVERAMYVSFSDRFWDGGTAGRGARQPETRWTFAEGATGFFNTYLLLGNPNTSPATVTVVYQLTDGTTITRSHTLPAESRTTVDVPFEAPSLASAVFGMDVTSTLPIVAERAMWWQWPWYEGGAGLGSTETGTVWAVGEAAEGGAAMESTFVLVSNRTNTAGQVRLTVVYDDGTREEKDYTLNASARLTVRIGDDFNAAGKQFSVLVESLGSSESTPGVQTTVEVSRYQSPGRFGEAGGAALATKVR
jgi:hypothetical protein